MKTTIVIAMALAVTAIAGCMSPRGGNMSSDEGFKIGTPTFTTDIRQGDRKTITLSLHRDKYFKQNVRLNMKASEGISVDPTEVTVRASDTPDVQLQIAVPRSAALGEYRVFVKGTPETGQPTSTEVKVKVVAP
jgi:uncharacterized membrane protein